MFVSGFGEIYTVVKGDTLGKLATRYNTTVAAIAKENNIPDVNKIEIGQVLNIGESKATKEATSPSLSLPQVSLPKFTNKQINYFLAGSIVVLGVPLVLAMIKKGREQKARGIA